MAYHYIHQRTLESHEVWIAQNQPYGNHTVRIWPVYDQPDGETRYKCQDGFLYTWFMSGPEHQEALQQGFNHNA